MYEITKPIDASRALTLKFVRSIWNGNTFIWERVWLISFCRNKVTTTLNVHIQSLNFHSVDGYPFCHPQSTSCIYIRENVPDPCRAHTRLLARRPHKSSWEFEKYVCILTLRIYNLAHVWTVYVFVDVCGMCGSWSSNKSLTWSFAHLRIWWSELCHYLSQQLFVPFSPWNEFGRV